MPDQVTDRVTELLVKAVRQLPQPEQDEVLGVLLSARVLEPVPSMLGLGGRIGAAAQPLGAWPTGMAVNIGPDLTADPEPQLKVLPVRLPVADHDRLRAFSREHGFSMAVIIRTLVERFLDEQMPRTQLPRADGPEGTDTPPSP